MRTDQKPENQHYIPQMLLRFHATINGKHLKADQVWCFDKAENKVFLTSTANILSERQFYEIELAGNIASLESSLSSIENQVCPVIKQLIETRNTSSLTVKQKRSLSSFLAIQFLRTKASRQKMSDLVIGFVDALRKRGLDPAQIEGYAEPTGDIIKLMFLEEVSVAPQIYGQYFFNKHWSLIQTTVDDPFWIGDHPVVLDNDFLRGQPASRGLNSPSVSIYFPLTPTLCLVLVDQAIIEDMKASYQQAKRTREKYKKVLNKSRGRIRDKAEPLFGEQEELVEQIYRMLRPILKGTPSEYSPAAVIRANSLQVEYAERWIVSSRQDFSLSQQMIADDARYKSGRRYIWE